MIFYFEKFLSLLKNLLRNFAQRNKFGKIVWDKLAKIRAILLNDRRDLWIPKNLGVENFFITLNDQQCNYVVLRWFESLPNYKLVDDVDILIDDSDIKKIESLLTRSPRKGLIKCDVYTTSQLGEYLYKDIIYYPETLSKSILSTSQYYRNIIKVPSDIWYFNSLAYHAVYHKGIMSGLKSDFFDDKTLIEQDKYSKKLIELRSRILEPVEITLEGLHLYLSKKGLSPDIDILDRLGIENKFCSYLCDLQLNKYKYVKGLACFVVREPIVNDTDLLLIKNSIEKSGFEIIHVSKIKEFSLDNVRKKLRGGNWGNSKSAFDGGDPKAIIICIDPEPILPTDFTCSKSRKPDNQRVFDAKYKVRDIFFRQVLHSADNSRQAAHYIEIACPEVADKIFEKVLEH